MKSVVSPVLLFTAVTLMAAPRSEACGGFFCDGAGVLQAAERIVFVDDGEGNITTVVQIQYTGTADAFAWVLPVPGVPEVGVSSNIAFTRLQQATEPQFNLLRNLDGICQQISFPSAPEFATDGVAGGVPEPSVTVVGEGSVGPYDYDIIQVDMQVENKAAVALQWLSDNGYQQPPQTAELLGSYLDDNKNLIAFRLNKSADVGAIRPVVLRYNLEHSKIPLRPTAVAAAPDMGIMTWVVAPARVVPMNYRHAIINEAAVDWVTGGSNYNAVVTQAANEGDGQAFVTEDARATTDLGLIIHPFAERDAWTVQRNGTGDALDFVRDVAAQYGAFDGARDVIEPVVVLPQGSNFNDWFACPFCGGEFRLVDGFDREAFEDAFDAAVFAPLREMADIVESQAVITRLYTTMSADEMTLDPIFEANPTLPMVSNIHTATQDFNCEFPNQTTWVITLESGLQIFGRDFAWPVPLDQVAAAEQLLLENTTGAPLILADERESIRGVIDRINRDNGATGLRGGCGCGQASASLLPIALLALLRRRKHLLNRGEA
jgi:hypothetical protein